MNRFLFLILSALVLAGFGCSGELLVETESFKEKGGWMVDPQFVQQMGSPYLMAHGMGKSVVNARTSITFPSKGNYHVWARTMNWAPGDWSPPGQFSLLINGQRMPETLGTIDGWNWQYAGSVSVGGGDVNLELVDHTGFNGRVDALYFNKKRQAPPSETAALQTFRTEMLEEKEDPAKQLEFDLVVVGGGIAGCAASISAAEEGLNVALVHDRPVLGGNASSEIRVHTLGIYGHFSRILKMLDTEHYPNGDPSAFRDELKRHRNMESYTNIKLFLNYRAYTAHTDAAGGSARITAVDARHTSSGERIRFNAPYFIDCTGDGWIGYWAGADYMYGREAVSKYEESWEKWGELWSPSKPDNEILGSTLLWRTREAETSSEFPEVPWAMEVAGDHAARKGTWHWELTRNEWHQVDDAEKIRDHMLKAIYGSFRNEKQKSGTENLELEWVSHVSGKRESRRLVGDYIYTFEDMRDARKFPDSVVVEEREVDVHYRQNRLDASKPDFLTEAMFYPVERYYIPYRSLYSRDISNLFMAGRCFSCSHVGLGGPRVMRTTGQMGAATGYAAAVCIKYSCDPRDVYESYLEEYMEKILRSSDDSKSVSKLLTQTL